MSEKQKMICRMFVYGTLKEGRPLDRPLFAKTRTSVEEGTITGKIYHLGGYPGVKLEGSEKVQGEVHEFRAKDMKAILSQMDAIEGYREGRDEKINHYNRRIVTVTTKGGGKVDRGVAGGRGPRRGTQRAHDVHARARSAPGFP